MLMTTIKKRVLIVEDDVETARSFESSILKEEDRLSLSAVLHTVADAKLFLRSTPVDFCLVDLGLPDGSGLEVVRFASTLPRPVQVLVVTVFGDESNVVASIEAGASGYVLKDALTAPVATGILTLLSGGSALSPSVAKLILDRFRRRIDAAPNVAAQSQSLSDLLPEGERVHLSPREQEVLGLIARGFSYAEVSGVLEISNETVNVHLRNTYRKLSVHSRSEAVYEASRLGLIRVT